MVLFPLKVWVVLIFISTVVLVKEDIRKNGTFEESKTGMFLQDVGMYKQAYIIYNWADRLVTQTKDSARKSFPDYYHIAADSLDPVLDTVYSYANATVLSAKKWSYIVTHQRAHTYLPIVKENFYFYYQELKNLLSHATEKVVGFIFDSEFSNIIQSKVRLVWDPLKTVVQDTFSVKVDLHQVADEIKAALHASYEKIIDLLNLERTI